MYDFMQTCHSLSEIKGGAHWATGKVFIEKQRWRKREGLEQICANRSLFTPHLHYCTLIHPVATDKVALTEVTKTIIYFTLASKRRKLWNLLY